MTDASNPAAPNPAPELRAEVRQWCEAWKGSLQSLLAQVSGKPNAFEFSSQPLRTADSDLWFTVIVAGPTRGEMTLRLPTAAGVILARTFLGETDAATREIGTETPSAEAPVVPAEEKEALEELLRQVAGVAATALASVVGGEVQLHLSASAAPSWSSDAIVCLRSTSVAEASAPIAPEEAVALEIQISPALAAELRSRAQPAAHPQQSSSTQDPPSSSYRRLMDVGLDVKLRFGSRRMVLRDVLALCPGVVVELDNALHSPVDLLLDGRLIAQGEVVVVDGKYGLRITGVVDSTQVAGAPG